MREKMHEVQWPAVSLRLFTPFKPFSPFTPPHRAPCPNPPAAAIIPVMTDVELLSQHRKGSESAFADLVRRHLDWVYSLARRRLRDAHLAEDVAQAVFVLLHRKAPQFAGDGAMINWLYRTAWYTSESAARSQRRRVSHETKYAIERPEAIDPAQPPEWKELAPVLDKLIGQLSSSDREAILLRYYRDLSPAEIAQEIGTTAEAARKRTERAVERLRQMAQRQGIAMSSASLTAGLMQFVRLPAPPGLIATSTVVATAPAGSAMVGQSAAIVKGATAMMASTKIAMGSVVVASVILAGLIGGSIWIFADGQVPDWQSPGSMPATAPSSSAAAPGPFDANNPFAKSAPFSGIRWRGEVPEVEVSGQWWELVEVDDISVEQIFNSQKFNNDADWRKHFGEDLPEVMNQMHHPLAATVDLRVRTLDGTGKPSLLQGSLMTPDNRQSLMVWPADGQDMLFADIRWKDQKPQVKIGDTWYELVSVLGESAARLINLAKDANGDDWQNSFQKNLMKEIYGKNKTLDTADLVLRTLDYPEQVTMTIRAPQPAGANPGPSSPPAVAPNGQYSGVNSFKKAAPFSAIRWKENVPDVEVDGTWYELEAVDGLTLEQIHSSQDAHGDGNWRKHFGENLVEVLSAMNHTPGSTMDLRVRTLDGTDTEKTLSGVAMTEENRQALMSYPGGGQP
jgi:RNA polymerase sigma factor (sigma-70 family)